MRNKLTHLLIIVSLISLGFVFSAISNASSEILREKMEDYDNTTSAEGYTQYHDDNEINEVLLKFLW